MLITDEYIDSLPLDPINAVLKITSDFFEFDRQNASVKERLDEYDSYLELYTFLSVYLEENRILDFEYPILEENRADNINELARFVMTVADGMQAKQSEYRMSRLRDVFRAQLTNSFSYEFTEGDIKHIQEIINDLRERITAYSGFEAGHRARLLSRLEKLQSEIHKKVSDLDRFWGMIGDGGVVIKKFGEDAKPIVDRFRELADIVWRTQARAEELPSDAKSPLLSNKEEKEEA